MARPLRLQYEDAMYHVINRGNYRRDVFDSVGAAQAFETTLAETCEQYKWQLYAHVVMRNHYHLAIRTPHANLVEGMHWLQGTFATRFNRFRSERGHLFQGRYHALLIEDAAALARVVDYIHLNPVRAKIVPGEHVAGFRWSSLRRYVSGSRPIGLTAANWLEQLGFDETPEGWRAYVKRLIALGGDAVEQERLGFDRMSCGWAIGTDAWRKAIAQEHAHLALSPGLAGEHLREIKACRWAKELAAAMTEAGKTPADANREFGRTKWKLQIARRLRGVGASCSWVAKELNIGSPGSLRVYLCRPPINM